MTKTLANQTTFPIVKTGSLVPQWGLTKREYFAAMALQGLASIYHEVHSPSVRYLAKKSVEFADELINELNITK